MAHTMVRGASKSILVPDQWVAHITIDVTAATDVRSEENTKAEEVHKPVNITARTGHRFLRRRIVGAEGIHVSLPRSNTEHGVGAAFFPEGGNVLSPIVNFPVAPG